jgi:hypothetical protein
VSSNKSKTTPKGDYAVGYGHPPKANQFQPGQSGNLGGRPRYDRLSVIQRFNVLCDRSQIRI